MGPQLRRRPSGAGPDEVRVRYARSMADDRTSQTLSHQAFLLYDAMEAERERGGGQGFDEREVQGMLVNNRLLFASNFNESMDLLQPYTGDGSRDHYGDIVSQHQSDASTAEATSPPLMPASTPTG